MLRNHLPVEVLTLYYGPGIKGGNDGAIISYLWYYASQEPHAERRGLEKRLAQRKFLSTEHLSCSSQSGYKDVRAPPELGPLLATPKLTIPMGWYLSRSGHRDGSYYPGSDREKGNPLRIPVLDTKGTALMPCTPAKARHLFKSGKARPKWNKLGLCCVQLTYQQEPDNQPLVVGSIQAVNLKGTASLEAKTPCSIS